MNRVIDGYTAEIDGKRTALSGCNTTECSRRSWCLRADPKLVVRTSYRASDCRYLIHNEESAA